MDFSFSEEMQDFKKEVRQFLDENWPPECRTWRGWEAPETPEYLQKADELAHKLGAKGWISRVFPKEYAGTGGSFKDQFTLFDELWHARAISREGGYGPMELLAPIVIRHGTEEQKKRFLPAIARGEMGVTLGYSEANAGSDLASLETRAVREGDFYIVNGTKLYTSGAGAAAFCMLLARTDPAAPKHKGISLLIVDMKTPGITVRPIKCMGGAETTETFWDNVKVPVANRLGEENMGWRYVSTALDFERLMYGTLWFRALFNELVAFLKTAEYGDWRPREDPVLRSRVAQFSADLEAAQALEYKVLWMLLQGKVPFGEASMLKLLCTELAQRMTDTFTQFLGPYGQLTAGSRQAPLAGGLTQEDELSIGHTILGGTSEVQRNIIALQGLGLLPG